MQVRFNSSGPIIDVHGHFGYYRKNTPELFLENWMSADAFTVTKRATQAGIGLTVASPLAALLPRGSKIAVRGNIEAEKQIPLFPSLRQYVVVNPLEPATYRQAREMLGHHWCVGIKIHPEEHQYPIQEKGSELFEFFNEVRVPVLTHSGCPFSLPADFLPFVEKFPEVPLILAHLGNGAGDQNRPDLQVEMIKKVPDAKVYVDTSSARSILSGILEWAVDEIGPDRILFGTDTPLYSPMTQLARIVSAEITETAKTKILGENACRLFNFSQDTATLATPDLPQL